MPLTLYAFRPLVHRYARQLAALYQFGIVDDQDARNVIGWLVAAHGWRVGAAIRR